MNRRVILRPEASGKIEPSSSVATVRFRHHIVGHEFASVGLGQSSAHGHSFFIRHDVDAGAARRYFARIFGRLFLVFLRAKIPPAGRVSEQFDHYPIQYTTGPVTRNRATRLPRVIAHDLS